MDVLSVVFMKTLYTRSYSTSLLQTFDRLYPGNISNCALSSAFNCGHDRLVVIWLSGWVKPSKTSVTGDRAPKRSGLACAANWNPKQARLLPSRSVSAFMAPPVKSSILAPVKVLVLPVLPPMEANLGY